MEDYINLLLVVNNHKHINNLKEVLIGNGNNIWSCKSLEEAEEFVTVKETGIIIIDIDQFHIKDSTFIQNIRSKSKVKNNYIIALTSNTSQGIQMVKGMHDGVIDYITLPLNSNLVKAKIDVYKTLFFKDQKINSLLKNIFPENVLNALNKKGKFSPTRIENGIVLFTDFVHFSQKAKRIKPMKLLKKLEFYFNQFDEIIERYNLEKIKTIGDSYMVIGGVTEQNNSPAIRACLAALEMRDLMINEKNQSEALNSEYWEIRIGIHSGPLVAGIIGTKKISFDVWGDTVNIASSAEHNSESNQITITSAVREQIGNYFVTNERGEIEIKKRGGKISMYFLEKLKKKYSLYDEGKIPNQEIRVLCDLTNIDFNHMRRDILSRLQSLLPEELIYHDISHTLNVEKAALIYAKLEGVSDEDTHLLQTAVLFHDAGFIVSNYDNEKFGVQLAKKTLPKYGYTDNQIQIISSIIETTKFNAKEPQTILEKIMKDADHDYLGREDYFKVAQKLRDELENYGKKMNEIEWIEFQIDYLEKKHKFYTQTAQNIRKQSKQNRINDLKTQLKALKNI